MQRLMTQAPREHRPVNPDMITLARESRGLSQSKLAQRIRVSQGHLSKIEAGLLPVADGVLHSLSEALAYPASFFSLPDPVFGPSTCEFYHRKRQSLSTVLLKKLHAQINIRRIQIAKLLDAVDLPPINVPKIQPEETGESIAEIARAIRAMWQLPPGPVKDLTRAIEDAGGIVVRTDFGTPQLDAVSRWIPSLPPLFFVNRHAPGDRQRLTLAHELGHIVMHQVPNPNMEVEAFEFAAELLMPAREIRPYLSGVTIPRLAALKPVWKVSMAALVKRAQELGEITPRQYRFIIMRMNKLGFRTSEPPELDVPPEEPLLLSEILKLYRGDFHYSLGDLASLLEMYQDELQMVYNIAASSEEHRAQIRMIRAQDIS